jgi:hypothetical protein
LLLYNGRAVRQELGRFELLRDEKILHPQEKLAVLVGGPKWGVHLLVPTQEDNGGQKIFVAKVGRVGR